MLWLLYAAVPQLRSRCRLYAGAALIPPPFLGARGLPCNAASLRPTNTPVKPDGRIRPFLMSQSRVSSSTAQVSQLLHAWCAGDESALGKLMPLVYRELRYLARRQMRRERAGHSLQTTDLVNEAYLRLVDQRRARWQHRSQFFAVAANMMRRILVDHARRRRYQKRGGNAARIDIEDVVIISPERAADIVALDDALQGLEQHDKRKSSVVELRYFGGLTVTEIAELLGVSEITVKRDWSMAKAWLYRHMSHARDATGDHALRANPTPLTAKHVAPPRPWQHLLPALRAGEKT
jgi:RNA polymerase sigma-70 factor (ECF subfamily)